MPTQASLQALEGLRDLSTIQWYAIPLLSIVFYIYTTEMKKARRTGNWGPIYAGLTLFGMDFLNETWNGWVFHLTGRSACWTTPGPTALRLMVGWNLEIIFMFLLGGIIYYNTLSGEPGKKILGLPEKWFWAIGYAAFCVFIEVLLNMGGHLVWEYPFWNRSFGGMWLIFFFGYFHFYVAVILVLGMRSHRAKIMAVGSLYALGILANGVALGALGWVY